MKELLDKISSYNIFNYLLPGVIFSYIVTSTCEYNLVQKDLIAGAFIYYFVGLIISRFGSLIIEPLLKRTSFLKFADYKDFVEASKKDEKIDIISESNNMYRTLLSMMILIGLLQVYKYLEIVWIGLEKYSHIILILLLIVMFLFSYRKQSNYITKRINANKNE